MGAPLLNERFSVTQNIESMKNQFIVIVEGQGLTSHVIGLYTG
jgi:hypothetical protein